MIILGIDPGSVSGAMALLGTETGAAAVTDIPFVGRGRVNSRAMAAWINKFARHLPDHCFLENARTMPQQGISSTGRYMHAAGKIEAVVEMMGVPLTLIEPNVWKKAVGLRGKDKEAARLRAIHLFPRAGAALSRKKDHGRAEALLIARYGMHLLGMKVPAQLLGAA